MRIIIDCQPLLHHCVHPSASRFIIDFHKHLLQKGDETEWLFIMDKDFAENEVLKELPSKNMVFKKIFPYRLGWKLWYDYQLPAFIKNKADLLIITGGIASSSSIAQFTWIANMNGKNQSKKNKSYFNFYKSRLKKTIERSKIIFTASQKNKQQIIQQYGLDEKKIIVIRSTADKGFRVLSWPEKESVKTKYAAGKEYFIVVVEGQQQGLVNLLKAFSLFKKRLQSNMQMVFAGNELKSDMDFIEKLETFKYRQDIHIYDNISNDDLKILISAAYALVHSFYEDDPGTTILNAFKADLPVIVSDEGSLREIAADAALYASIHNPEILATQLMLLYKDENLRRQLIEKGKSQWQQFNWDESIKKLQDAILRAANNS